LFTSTDTEYLYYLTNASLTLRLVQYLDTKLQIPVLFITVIHQMEGWVVRIKLRGKLSPQDEGNFQAFLNELGITYAPSKRLKMALWSLEEGQCPAYMMRRYQIAVVSHGNPKTEEIEAFREQFVRKLGYCPETLA
jgi:hypothetical protein